MLLPLTAAILRSCVEAQPKVMMAATRDPEVNGASSLSVYVVASERDELPHVNSEAERALRTAGIDGLVVTGCCMYNPSSACLPRYCVERQGGSDEILLVDAGGRAALGRVVAESGRRDSIASAGHRCGVGAQATVDGVVGCAFPGGTLAQREGRVAASDHCRVRGRCLEL